MTYRYKIRAHESGNGDGSTEPGTIVVHLGGGTAVYADSADEVETVIRTQVKNNSLSRGCVYQICPPPGHSENLRSLAVALDGSLRKCFLDPARGMYSEFHRIRFPA